jgi:CSLREA domain-containing protein
VATLRQHFDARDIFLRRLQQSRALGVILMANFTVTTLGDIVDANDGQTSLREAVAQANGNGAGADTITFAAGLATAVIGSGPAGTIYLGALGELALTTSMTITGPGITLSALADTNGDGVADEALANNRVFMVSDGGIAGAAPEVTLNDLTLRDGRATTGGAIYLTDLDKLIVNNATFLNNHAAASGGAISNFDGVVQVTGSTFSANSAGGSGGAIFGSSLTSVTITTSTLSNNTAVASGGAVQVGLNSDGGVGTSLLTISGSTLSGNSAVDGGAVSIGSRTELQVLESTLSGNTATTGSGGGIYVANANTVNNIDVPYLQNVTLSGNAAGTNGGGIFIGEISQLYGLNAQNITVSGNTAQQGGGLYESGLSTAVLYDSILAGNTATVSAADVRGNIDSVTKNLFGTTSGATFTFFDFDQNGDGTPERYFSSRDDIIGPSLSDVFTNVQNGAGVLADNAGRVQTIALKASGIAVDVGSNLSGPTDARGPGFARRVDGPDADTTATSDLGAYEVQRPVANAQTLATNEDASKSGMLTGSDPQGTDVDFAITGTTNGTVTSFDAETGAFTFTPSADFAGAASIQFTATNGALSSPTQTVTINVAPVNDAPAGTDATLDIFANRSHTFAASEFGFTDPADNGANALQAVIVTTLPTAGALTLSGVAVTTGQSIAAASIPNLVYTPGPAATGDGYASFAFQVVDNGGTANGGHDTDLSPNTITFDLSPPSALVVTTLSDVVDVNDGVLSLREAVALANQHPDADAITFDASLSGGTIYVGALGELDINSSMTITGPDITLSAKADPTEAVADNRVFNIDSHGSVDGDGNLYAVALQGLTVQDGRDLGTGGLGGGIYASNVNLTLTNVTVANNAVSSGGGGVYAVDSTISAIGSTFTGNIASNARADSS